MVSPEKKERSPKGGGEATLVWRVPENGISIYIRTEVVETLAREVQFSLSSFREAGGFLLGRASSDSERAVLIEDYQPVKSENSAGSAYVLTSEQCLLSEAAAHFARPSSDRRMSVVGFYRTHLRRGWSLATEDRTLFTSYFMDPTSVFLLLKPQPGRGTHAGFFFWEQGRVRHKCPFEFGPDGLPQATPDPGLFPEDVPVAPIESIEASGQEKPTWRARWPWTAAAVLLIGLGSVLFQGARALVILREKATARLGLAVERNGGDLVINWDAKSPVVQQARNGSLRIADGSFQRQINLDGGLLRAGQMVYSPETSNVLLELDIAAGKLGVVRESVRVLGSPHKASATRILHEPEPPVRRVLPANRLAAAKPVIVQSKTLALAAAQPVETARQELIAPPSVGLATIGPATQLVPPSAIASPPVLPPPLPTVGLAELPPNRVGQGPAPPVRERNQTVSSELAPGPKNDGYFGPKAIRQVAPTVPTAVRTFITHDVDIEMKAFIDARGRVTNVLPVSRGPEYLQKLAAKALLLWRFQPAKANDQNVPSETRVVFRFRPVSSAFGTRPD